MKSDEKNVLLEIQNKGMLRKIHDRMKTYLKKMQAD